MTLQPHLFTVEIANYLGHMVQVPRCPLGWGVHSWRRFVFLFVVVVVVLLIMFLR